MTDTPSSSQPPSLLLRHLRGLIGQVVTFDRAHDDPVGVLREADERHALLESAGGDVDLVALDGVRKVGSGPSVTSQYESKRRLAKKYRDRIESAQAVSDELAVLRLLERAEAKATNQGERHGGNGGEVPSDPSEASSGFAEVLADMLAHVRRSD